MPNEPPLLLDVLLQPVRERAAVVQLQLGLGGAPLGGDVLAELGRHAAQGGVDKHQVGLVVVEPVAHGAGPRPGHGRKHSQLGRATRQLLA